MGPSPTLGGDQNPGENLFFLAPFLKWGEGVFFSKCSKITFNKKTGGGEKIFTWGIPFFFHFFALDFYSTGSTQILKP